MRSIKRSTASLALLVALAISLAGCMHVDRAVTINGDGSGSYMLTIGFSEQLISLASDQISSSMDQYGAKVKSQGGSYRHYDDTGYSYWAYTRPFSSIADLNTLIRDTPQASDTSGATGASGDVGSTAVGQSDTFHFTEQSGFLFNSFHVTGHMSMMLPTSATDTSGMDITPLLKDMRESFSVTMPGSITAHTGGSVSGNTVTYVVHYGEQTDIDVSGSGFNTALLLPIGIIVLVVLLIIAAIIAVMIFWRRRSARAERVAPAAPPAFVASPDAPTTPEFPAQPGDATTQG